VNQVSELYAALLISARLDQRFALRFSSVTVAVDLLSVVLAGSIFRRIICVLEYNVDFGSSVAIVTCYGMDGPAIESRWGRDFPHPYRPALPPPPQAFHTMGAVLFPGIKLPGRSVDHPPTSSTEVEERVELYLCSPLRLHGLF
jgi:hypothetical protein